MRFRILLILLAIFCFIKIASEISEAQAGSIEWVTTLDNSISKTAFDHRSDFFTQIARPVTFLGSIVFLSIVTVVTACILFWTKELWSMGQMLACGIGATLLSYSTKAFFNRDRPDIYDMLDRVSSSSFPSGHSLGAMAIYLSLGLILWEFQRRKSARIFTIFLMLALALLIGLSRIYLGVHYPTDVLAGFMLGAAWAILCWDATNLIKTKMSKAN